MTTVPAPLRLARRLGFARGLLRDGQAQSNPDRLLELYSMEGCPSCRRVRNVLTELDLDFVHRSCPKGESRTRTELAARGGKVQLPFLADPNHGVELYDSQAIIAYLYSNYSS